MKFEKKPEIAEGVRWDGTVEGFETIHAWAQKLNLTLADVKTTVLYHPIRIQVDLMIHRKEYHLYAGDWLIADRTTSGWDVRCLSDHAVETFYKPVDE